MILKKDRKMAKRGCNLERTVRFYSNNINGLNSPNKRNKVFHNIKKGGYDIVALQETHICQKHVSHLTYKHLGKEFYSASIEKKRGVVLYVKEWIPAELAFKDNEGRILGVFVYIENEKNLICNIYAPNGSKINFIKKLNDLILKQEFKNLIILGDFNGVLNTELDKTRKSNKNNKKRGNGTLPKNFINFQQEFNLQDVWRSHHPLDRDYTFFSDRHQVWSRIDMVWASSYLITKITKIEILTRNHSDHSPIQFTINETRRTGKWRLNDILLKSEEDIKKNRLILKEYFQINDTPEVNIQTIWDASKAVMRGYFIRQNSWRNKLRNQKLNKIQEQIIETETKLKKSPKNQKLTRDIELLKLQKSNIELEQLAKKLKFVKQDHFQNANKPGKWLAKKIGRKKQRQYITRIEDGEKHYRTDKEILRQFETFYKTLYKKDQIKKDDIAQYLSKRKLEKISEEQRERLNKSIEEEEIKKAIRKMDPNKAPGPDGLTVMYYKTFEEELLPYLKKLMNKITNEGKLPNTWKEANITVIHKEKTDPTNVKNYRPISLLNIDYKIFTNILADRMKEFLKNWIQEEQTGFLPNRQLRDNVRTIVDIIEYYEANNEKELALLTVDAEKAFDNINWNFFKMLMRELDLGYKFLNAINAIYEDQTAKIWINGHPSKEIKINKGTRQGCPLSPLIFIFTLEILLNTIRNDASLKGTKIRNMHYKTRAFADDLICIIENPTENIKKWLHAIEEFGTVAGFKINKSKSKMLTKKYN
uniref:Reverse transcriptase domain-containing protein n=1 Tax=Anolis carolinensis TaxID=28377 RepID=A0A803TLB1_ANOCA